jgi:hypothetical protein
MVLPDLVGDALSPRKATMMSQQITVEAAGATAHGIPAPEKSGNTAFPVMMQFVVRWPKAAAVRR